MTSFTSCLLNANNGLCYVMLCCLLCVLFSAYFSSLVGMVTKGNEANHDEACLGVRENTDGIKTETVGIVSWTKLYIPFCWNIRMESSIRSSDRFQIVLFNDSHLSCTASIYCVCMIWPCARLSGEAWTLSQNIPELCFYAGNSQMYAWKVSFR